MVRPADRLLNELLKLKIANMKYIDRAPIFKLYGGQEEWPGPERVH